EESGREVAAGMPSAQRLVLTGFMGAGKSTVGPRLASALGWIFADLDEAIVRAQRASIADLFASMGEQAFRELELEALACALQRAQIVLALGGGVLESAASRSLLTNDPNSLMVYLEAPLEELLARCDGQQLSQDGAPRRPVLEDRAKVAERFLRRRHLYE
ncbi:Shikimate kinase, partial [mine drainage metagenome]